VAITVTPPRLVDRTGKTTPTDIKAAISPRRDAGCFEGAGTQDDPIVIPLKNLDLSDSAKLENLYQGVHLAIPQTGSGDDYAPYIKLDLSQCTASAGTITGGPIAAPRHDRFAAITLPAAVTTLAVGAGLYGGAFESFRGLKSISAPGVTTVGDTAFWGCTALTEVRLGATAPTTVGSEIFRVTKGSIAPTRTIYIRFPSTSGVSLTWVADNSSKWTNYPTTLPDGGIAQGTY
jgi:hypothetical protein